MSSQIGISRWLLQLQMRYCNECHQLAVAWMSQSLEALCHHCHLLMGNAYAALGIGDRSKLLM